MLAYLSFSALSNPCDPETGTAHFPCAVDGLYNKNFLDLPIIG
jgi:hypothetical protein